MWKMQQVWKKIKKLILDPVKNGSELEIHQEIGSNIIHLLNVERFNVIRQLFVTAHAQYIVRWSH